jgi:hypothetical protein
MARNKRHLLHPASWIHAAIHGVLQGLVFGWLGGLVLGVLHMLIDTRIPLRWWSDWFAQTQTGEMGTHVFIWTDQVIHIVTIALWIAAAPYLSA